MRSGSEMGQDVKVLITASDSLLYWLTQLQFFWHTPWHPLPAETCSKSPEITQRFISKLGMISSSKR